jgi:hypothetical protein
VQIFFNKKQLMKKGLLTLAILEVCRKMALVVEVEHRSTFTFSFQFLKPCTLHRCTLGQNEQKNPLFFSLFFPDRFADGPWASTLNLEKKYPSMYM